MQLQDSQRPRELTVADALSYLDKVKAQFSSEPEVYDQFLAVMKEFKADTITTPEVVVRVANLFRGYPDLIAGFNVFLPQGYSIRPDASIEMNPQLTSRY